MLLVSYLYNYIIYLYIILLIKIYVFIVFMLIISINNIEEIRLLEKKKNIFIVKMNHGDEGLVKDSFHKKLIYLS